MRPYLAHLSICSAIYVRERGTWKFWLLAAVPDPPSAR
jgi:hypothetical protein